MKRSSLAALALLALLTLLSSAAPAQVARTEYLAVPSLTLTDQQFLTGDKAGVPVTLAGALRLPKPGTDKLPLVMLIHGSGGVGGAGGSVDAWSNELNAWGIATFALDSFTARGITSTVSAQWQLGRLAMIYDIYRALEIVSRHPRIDAARIAVMGFSRGGQAVLYASLDRFQKMHGPAGGAQVAAYVALYPTCNTTFRGDEEVAAKPIRILHGAADNYVPVAPCRDYVARLTKAARDVKLVEYAGAHHVFDAPGAGSSRVIAAAQTTRNCRLAEGEGGEILNLATQKPFGYANACVEKGPTIAYDEAAATQARAYVKELLAGVFAAK